MADSVPKPPKGTKAGGRRLWRSVVGEFELDEHEMTMLRQATATVDLCDDLASIVAAEGPLLESRAHPALVELRQQRILLSRLLVALRVPIGDADARQSKTDPVKRLQRRGTRGFYPKAVS